jgi:hypothetical protein
MEGQGYRMLGALLRPLLLGPLLAGTVLLGSMAHAADTTDRLGVPGPLQFDGSSYQLAWSSQPSPDYVKQEYLPAGDSLPNYREMVLVEALTRDIAVMDAVRSQMELLQQRKANDPLVNMSLMQNPDSGEALLDFVISGRDEQGQLLLEWNAYRYAVHPQGGVLLLGISRRAYGDDAAKAFLGELKTQRTADIQALTQAALPDVK